MSRVLLYDKDGNCYAVLQDSIRKQKTRRVKVKLQSNATAAAVQHIGESFNEPKSAPQVSATVGQFFQALVDSEADSISFSMYQGMLQVAFWKRGKTGSSKLAGFDFNSAQGFVQEASKLV